jgi:hypothetical protein
LVGTPALKEWAVIVRALLAGEQILDVRKGGVREAGRHFGLDSNRCWLYPTVEHQRPELLRPAYRRWVGETEAAALAGRAVRIEGWADVAGTVTITEPDELGRLASKLIWTDDYVASRLRWKRRDPLWVLALRVQRLLDPVTLPWRDEYAGCASWLELVGLPDDPSTLPHESALSDESFAARVTLIERELGRPFESPRAADRGKTS